MNSDTILYLTRHGQTMLNATKRVQGWADAPLTPEGRTGITYLSKGLKEIPFSTAYSSDSGRAQETTRLILEEHLTIAHHIDPRIREWNFGSFEGELEANWMQLMAQHAGFQQATDMMTKMPSYEQIANAIFELDERGWAEPYKVIEKRIFAGMTDIAETENGHVLVVAHGLTIAHFLSLVSGQPIYPQLENGSVSKVRYRNGQFDVLSVNDMTYLEQGK